MGNTVMALELQKFMPTRASPHISPGLSYQDIGSTLIFLGLSTPYRFTPSEGYVAQSPLAWPRGEARRELNFLQRFSAPAQESRTPSWWCRKLRVNSDFSDLFSLLWGKEEQGELSEQTLINLATPALLVLLSLCPFICLSAVPAKMACEKDILRKEKILLCSSCRVWYKKALHKHCRNSV